MPTNQVEWTLRASDEEPARRDDMDTFRESGAGLPIGYFGTG